MTKQQSERDGLQRSPSRPSWASLLLWSPALPLVLFCRPALSYAKTANITVDDASELIVYTPSSSWHASSDPCSTCIRVNPDVAFGGTWHQGLRPIGSSSPPPGLLSENRSGSNKGQDNAGKEGHGHGANEEYEEDEYYARASAAVMEDPSSLRESDRFFTPNFERADVETVDQPVSARFNFTGSAIYVYALVSQGVDPAVTAQASTNLTFLLDSHPIDTYQHSGAASASGTLHSQLVFAQDDLPKGPHSLTIEIGPGSVLLLDYVVYTGGNISGGRHSSNEAITSASTAPGARDPAPKPKSNNIATFAGAVGGSVGLLAVLALSLAISIYRRRVRAARRDRHLRQAQNVDFDGESFHTDASEDGPPMHGPAPFIPRYFPGTVVPAPPPPYSPPSEQTAALLAAASPISSPLWAPPRLPLPGEDTSYADRLPPTPPPLPEDGLDDYFAPPSFPQAISSPIPAMLAGYAPVATTSSAPVTLSASPVPRHANGPESRGVYATVPPTSRSRRNSDAWSQRSDWSDRPPSFASQAPPLIPLPPPQQQQPHEGQVVVERQQEQQRTSDEDRNSVRSARSR
ncbi:hypothetical protein C8Q77DRAFT_1058582 [Trametes polyzona]|nr:hypothetical protein C8Q77DRAFT_1058582 [Trametes polyzona]